MRVMGIGGVFPPWKGVIAAYASDLYARVISWKH
jgi:hypothetical protein